MVTLVQKIAVIFQIYELPEAFMQRIFTWFLKTSEIVFWYQHDFEICEGLEKGSLIFYLGRLTGATQNIPILTFAAFLRN